MFWLYLLVFNFSVRRNSESGVLFAEWTAQTEKQQTGAT
jgi:hypothetical protein